MLYMEFLGNLVEAVMWLGKWTFYIVGGFLAVVLTVFCIARAATSGFLDAKKQYRNKQKEITDILTHSPSAENPNRGRIDIP